MNEANSVIFASLVCIAWVEYCEQFLQKLSIGLNMVDNIDLVEEYQRVQDRERGVVEDARKDNVFEVLQSPCLSDFLLNDGVFHRNHFSVSGLVLEVLPMVGFVCREVRVI